MKFITDRNLGKLARWLRALGYDTAYHGGNADRAFLRKAQSEGRVALSRTRALAQKQFGGTLLILAADQAADQLQEVLRAFSLQPERERFFSRCLRCNERLVGVPKEEVRGRVPVYTFDTQEAFRVCPICQSIFWPGTHRKRAEDLFRKRIPKDRP